MFCTFIAMPIQHQSFTERKLSIKINEPHSSQYLVKTIIKKENKTKTFFFLVNVTKIFFAMPNQHH